MTFYFSATGNNKSIAEHIAAASGDIAISIEEYDLKDIVLDDGEMLGFVLPAYYLRIPLIVERFINRTKFSMEGDHYSFGVITYGSTSGGTGTDLKKKLAKRGVFLDALFSILTPDTWTVVFNLSDSKRVQKTLNKTAVQLDGVTKRIVAREKGDFRTRHLPYISSFCGDIIFRNARKTSHFHVEDNCTGCGKCARNCPVNALEMKGDVPSWRRRKCEMCLRCLHNCPVFAIQYGSSTLKHGQYLRNKYQ